MLSDHQTFQHLLNTLSLPVNLRRTDPHASGVQYGIRTAEDHNPPMLGDGNVISVTPDAWELLEVRRFVFCIFRIVPESDRH